MHRRNEKKEKNTRKMKRKTRDEGGDRLEESGVMDEDG